MLQIQWKKFKILNDRDKRGGEFVPVERGWGIDKAVRLSKEEFVLGSEAEGSSQGKGNHQFKSQAGSESGAHVHQRRRSRPVDRSWNVLTRVRVGNSLEEAHFILEGKPEFGELDFPGLLV
ncbi:hypothetical protein Acr_27g0001720 [Actinidia rufa]|uniref:Uncharacterized protein n=1 Tax=Actinidia rufa TaxID=165716 RepID=A0A7J0H5Q5_9ERIC|nr:hypothetical protein Acr_27g0001720 [Actinidia rufa]